MAVDSITGDPASKEHKRSLMVTDTPKSNKNGFVASKMSSADLK